MNTLTYLSRQFDVLATARTPPSTPTSGSPSIFSGQFPSRAHTDIDHDSLKRVKTWSTKSFLFPPSDSLSSPSSPPRRSFSSPTDLINFASAQPSITSPPSQPSSLSSPSKSTVKGVIRRLFFIRLFVLVFHLLCAAWSSVRGINDLGLHKPVSVVSSTDADNTEPEQEKESALVQSQTLSPSLPSLSRGTVFRIQRSADDRPIAVSIPQEPELPPPSPPLLSPAIPEPPVSLETSRTPTPVSNTRKSTFQMLPKTLVLDLDETLIHSTSSMDSRRSTGTGFFGLNPFGRRNKGSGDMVEVVLGGRSTLYHVYKRPNVDFFLRTVAGWYTLVIFTASVREYADPVIDLLDAGRGILVRRLFRDSCTQLPNGSYTKDLTMVEQDLARVCLVDNSPVSYGINEANGIPIEGWTDDPSDEALLDLLPVLDSLRFTNDVRRVLGIRGFSFT